MSENIVAPTRKGVRHLVGADDKILSNGQCPASAP
jgi:hypothetical protein